ncbi:MAG: hypothetical protein EKK52_09255 [Burkholderiales bacterium]|uniref:hypothetical protein n=1 Tax=Roseateles sp. TaxID=1971397 RepID=UPI000FBCF377|nr:MAG: hypothetical protein EKK52_09255 [Burkholderiales bacterium]
MPDTISIAALRPGDILLHAGTGEISKLIKWASDSLYSHAALVYAPGLLAEAISGGVHLDQSIAARLADHDEVTRIDVVRPVNGGQPLTGAQVGRLQAAAQALQGRKFALNQMAELGLICVLRNKLTDNMAARRLIHWLLNEVVPENENRLVCSEFVYLAFHGTQDAALDPQIVVTPAKDLPWPDVDYAQLLEEYLQARRRVNPAQDALALEALTPDPTAAEFMAALEAATVSELSDLEARLATARAGLQALRQPAVAASAGLLAAHEAAVNAFLVVPEDLRNSPSFQFLGQLMP